MPIPPTAELVCSFSTVKTKPMSPFSWLLLKTLQTFECGQRPSFEVLAQKLSFQDTEYLRQAWGELEQFRLCEQGEDSQQTQATSLFKQLTTGNAIDYAHAKLTGRGEQALDDGFIRVGSVRERTDEVLYFIERDGSPLINWKSHYKPKQAGAFKYPTWARKVTSTSIAKALENQRESSNDHIDPEEEVFDLEIHWDECRRVKLD